MTWINNKLLLYLFNVELKNKIYKYLHSQEDKWRTHSQNNTGTAIKIPQNK